MANANIAEVNFAAMADALEKPTSCLPHLSLAAYLEMMTEGETRKHVEHTAARLGCNPAGTNRLLDDAVVRAKALNHAHWLIEALIPHEREIKALLGA
jgi:hypothetical protein